VRELPSGTVTFLFTDIEGSTRLLQELGDRYPEALAEHRRLLRDTFGERSGVEIDTQGDAFFVAFSRAQDAVSAAAAGQAALSAGPISVRMGLHTGEPMLTEEGYVGIDVHRAARIAAAGHGGQVLLSQTTRDLLDSTFDLRDLGEHRLKDLTEPERIYQLGHDELPPLKSLNQTNLPVQPTSLIGRARELDEILALVRARRLVTLTGPGGAGKTRLGLQAAAEVVGDFRDGVWFVSLSALRDPKAVSPTIAQTLGVAQPQTLHGHLEHKQVLLLLDNFEQLLDAAPLVAELLQRTPGTKVIATSRSPLHLAGEREYAVPPLADDDAVALFVERVRSAKPSFEPDDHVSEVCRRLDNLPLAVELAAARTNVLTPAQLQERLEQSLPLLSGGTRDAPERQRTLRATIDWSYELLTEGEKQLFRSVAVFAGSFDVEAAEEVCEADLDTLASLVDKSLLRQTAEGRFFLLATIREYAAERLAVEPASEELRRRHAERTLRVAVAAASRRHEGLDELQALHDDARAALDFLAGAGETELALRLAVAFGDYWFVRGHVREGQQRLEAALADGADAPADLRVGAMIRAASLARVAGDADGAERHALAALELARELSDAPAVAGALRELAQVTLARDDHARTLALYDEALSVARNAGDSIVPTLIDLADVALAAGEFERAIAYAREAAELAYEPASKAIADFNIASALIQLQRLDEAPAHLRPALEGVVRLDYPELIGWCLIATSALAAATEPREALLLLGSGEAAVESAGAALGPAERRLRGWILGPLLERVEADEVEKGLDTGRSLSIEDAVLLARRYLG
jgi:predicted ATPase/class 3 adenylate cyclase/predicted negative regulator of RcsB-dependent stress response